MLKLTQLPIDSIANLLSNVKNTTGIYVKIYINSDLYSNFYGF